MHVLINLKSLLKEKSMTQHELSEKTGIRQPSISEMCNNKTERLPLQNLALICDILECEISDVLKLERKDGSDAQH